MWRGVDFLTMKGVIVIPNKIKIGLYSIMVKEVGEELVAECGNCGVELDPHKIQMGNESEWLFCSDKCADNYINNPDNIPDGGY